MVYSKLWKSCQTIIYDQKYLMKTIIIQYLFFLSQNSDKTDCKSSVLWVQISCCLFLLVFPSLKVCVCCRFCLSKDRLCWLPFIAYYFFYSKYIYFRYQNTKKFLIDVVSVYTLVNA